MPIRWMRAYLVVSLVANYQYWMDCMRAKGEGEKVSNLLWIMTHYQQNATLIYGDVGYSSFRLLNFR